MLVKGASVKVCGGGAMKYAHNPVMGFKYVYSLNGKQIKYYKHALH